MPTPGDLAAMLAGRATKPTRAEMDAHYARNRTWRVEHANGVRHLVGSRSELHCVTVVRWWACDEDGWPCEWPSEST